jgi:hypothetical protein
MQARDAPLSGGRSRNDFEQAADAADRLIAGKDDRVRLGTSIAPARPSDASAANRSR